MEERSLEQMRQAVDQLRQRMDAAARQAGRSPAEVQLCAACKTHPAATVAASAGLAIDLFGENHVQELCANFDAGAYCGKPCHLLRSMASGTMARYGKCDLTIGEGKRIS